MRAMAGQSDAKISIHVPLARDDLRALMVPPPVAVFQSTSLLRGTTRCTSLPDSRFSNFNPRPSCEGRRGCKNTSPPVSRISIHVPLARDDGRTRCGYIATPNFNPRPSCEGRPGTDGLERQRGGISIHVPLARDDPDTDKPLTVSRVFQSTSLLRGTTGV